MPRFRTVGLHGCILLAGLATGVAPAAALVGQDHWSVDEVMRVTDDRFFDITGGELGENGEIWIANEGTSQVLHFSGHGEPWNAFGREGRGPDEMVRRTTP